MTRARGLIGLAVPALAAIVVGACAPAPASQDPSDSPLTDRLNSAMSPSASGVLVRVPDNETSPLVSSTLLRDDILVPSMVFNPAILCNGSTPCEGVPFAPDVMFRFPYLAVVVDQRAHQVPVAAMYASDADTDNRCEQASTSACPGEASTLYGSGRGCVDYQVVGSPADFAQGCQCPVGVSGADWLDGVLKGAEPLEPYTYFQGNDPSVPWFEPGGATGKAPMIQFMDASACWTDDVSQMVSLQNALWEKRYEWWNGQDPGVPRWAADPATSPDPLVANSIYAGWNEVVVDRKAFDSGPGATVIVLPSGAQSLSDLDRVVLEGFASRLVLTNEYEANPLPLLGNPIVLLRQVSADGGKTWTRNFFAQSFDFRPYGIPAVLQCGFGDACTMEPAL